ncbi:MAG: protein kinase, partial [Myxococcota bacterium]
MTALEDGGPDPFIGRRLGRWTLQRRLGAGAVGAVYEAVHEHVSTRSAVKILHPHYVSDQEARDRFRSEAELHALLKSENVVRLLEFGVSDDGVAWMALELLEGKDLSVLLQERRCLPFRLVLWIVAQVAEGLMEVHLLNIVHRDIKPSNI